MTPVLLQRGDCLEVMAAMDPEIFDAVVTDPPYHLTSIVKRFGGDAAAEAQHGTDGLYRGSPRGFMGKEWDGGDIAFRPETWAAVMRVVKPGGYLVAFNHSRTWHRMAVAIEDSGWEIRDSLMWLYGTGFPKSHDVRKGIDKALGAEREIIAERPAYGLGDGRAMAGHADGATAKITAPATPEAAEWAGWGTALKPAFEPIVLARKPLRETSVAKQHLATGTGGLNIDAARIPASDAQLAAKYASVQNAGPRSNAIFGTDARDRAGSAPHEAGRWPANVVTDGSREVVDQFPVDSGGESVSRFFYCAKAGKADRGGSNHPTVKPQALMRWLVRLVSAPGARILDPFAGSGSTGWAAHAEGRACYLIERDPEYACHIEERIRELYREARDH